MFVFFVLETVMEYTFKFGGKKTDPVFQKLFDFLFLERGCYQLICFEIFRHSLSYKIVMQGFLEIHMWKVTSLVTRLSRIVCIFT